MPTTHSKMINQTAFPIGEKFNIEELITHLQHKINTGYTTKGGNSYKDWKMTVDMKFSEDGEYEGTRIHLKKKEQ
jgi:hypothetical protein